MRLPTTAGMHGADDDVDDPSVAPDEMLRVPARRFVQLWSVVAIASALGKLLADEFDVGRSLNGPVLAAIAVTVGLVGMLALIRRRVMRSFARTEHARRATASRLCARTIPFAGRSTLRPCGM